MATRRRGGADLEDLKARLGYSADADADAEAKDAPADAAEADAAATDGGPDPEPSAPATSASAGPALDEEDYSQAVSELETAAPVDYDPHAVDPNLKAPGGGTSMIGLVIAAVASLVVGFFIGQFLITANTARATENAMRTQAGALVDEVRATSVALTSLENTLAGIDAEAGYRPPFEEALAAAYGETRPVLDTAAVSGAAHLMIYDASLGEDLISYAIATSYLASAVERHLVATRADAEEIQRITAGLDDDRAYAVAINFQQQATNWESFLTDETGAALFEPIHAERVTYAPPLALQAEGEGDAQFDFYPVQRGNGEDIQVAAFDLVLLGRDQLLPPLTNENALGRYRARTAQLKELLTQITASQARLLTQLEEVANQQEYATLPI